MSLSEFEVIDRYFKRQRNQASVVKGVGDDCAIVTLEPHQQLVMSMDTLVSGRHFPESSSPSQIATRSFCTCISDLAAMGATPKWFTLALTLPDSNTVWLNEFSQSLFAIADEFSCELIGGDTTQGPLVITLQVHGVIENTVTMTRDAAKTGDAVFVSGYLGDGAAALSLLQEEHNNTAIDANTVDYLISRFYRPEPQIKTGLAIVAFANAAIDISDGLLADLQHIANASQVNIEIDIDAIPLSDACKTVADNQDKALQFALTGGDDYQLAFTVPANKLSIIENLIKKNKISAVQIGTVVDRASASPEILCFQDGKIKTVNNRKGYQHFASSLS